jgi:hypothetical protein
MPLNAPVWDQCNWQTAEIDGLYARKLHRFETEERVDRALRRGLFDLDVVEALAVGIQKFVADLPGIYQRRWEESGHAKSPEFVRELLSRVILPAIRDELEWSEVQIEIMSRRPKVRVIDADGARRRLKVFAKYYAGHWREKTDATAVALASRKPRRGRPPVSRPETKALKQAVLRARDELTRADLDPHSTKSIVGILARDGTAPTPKPWRSKFGVRSWTQVLSKPELMRRAAKIFTKIKTASP